MKLPLLLLICAAVGSFIALIVSIAINATIANEPDNDLGTGFGWFMLTTAPAIGIVWSAVDFVLYWRKLYHPIYWLVSTFLLLGLFAGFGGAGTAVYSWDTDGSWVAGMIQIFMAVFYLVSMSFAAKAVHERRMALEYKTSGYE